MLGTNVYIPMFNEVSPLPDDTSNRWIVNWTINHLPPEGAKYYRWGYAGNSLCSDFIQYIVSSIADGTVDESEMTVIDITPLQTLKTTVAADGGVQWNQFPASNISPYEWRHGDRIRFITKDGTPDTPTSILGDLIDGMYDMEIIKQDTSDNTIYVQKFNWAAAGITTGENCLVEIYHPLREASKEVFYEFGPLLRIIEDSAGVLVHEGGDGVHDQDTATGVAAEGVFNYGDVYHIVRTPSKLLDIADPQQGAFHESMWWSDFYDSSDWDRGKIGLETNFGERYLNIIRHSNPYLQNTQINGLSTFEAENYKELNDVFGNIVAIYELGDTLKCYQERKASSILIGRTQYTDAEGNETVAISTSVLGGIRYATSNYSTIYPESIARNNR
jgi:hypothetical protein